MKITTMAATQAAEAEATGNVRAIDAIERWDGVTARALPLSDPRVQKAKRQLTTAEFGKKDVEKLGVRGIEGGRFITFVLIVDHCLQAMTGLQKPDGTPAEDFRAELYEAFVEDSPLDAAFKSKRGGKRLKPGTWNLFTNLLLAITELDDEDDDAAQDDDVQAERDAGNGFATGSAGTAAAVPAQS